MVPAAMMGRHAQDGPPSSSVHQVRIEALQGGVLGRSR